jgi:hypothetical protein
MKKFFQLAVFLVLVSLSAAESTTYSGTIKNFALNPANNTFYVSQYPGADVGAKINAADAAAGAGSADIRVTAAGNVSTVPTIRSNHRLILTAPLTWTVAPVLNSNTKIIGTGSIATQTVNAPSAWIVARNLSNVEIENLWVTNASVPTTEGSQILACLACSNIVMNWNHGFRIGIFRSGTTSANYAAVTSTTLTANVHLEGNRIDGNEFTPIASSRFITLAFLMFATNATLIGNDAFNCEYNLEWWGGNAGTEGRTLTNPRWARNIKVTGGSAVNVAAGFWGSMGQNIAVTDVTSDTCLDVCLDAESSTNVSFSKFTVHNAGNGGLAVFFGSIANEFGPGIVTSDTAASVLMFLHNVSANPLQSFGVKIHHVKFICSDLARLCDLKADPIGSLQFNDNELSNSALTFIQTNNSGFEISRNRFSYTFAPTAFSAIKISGQIFNHKPISVIAGNTFESSVIQLAGTFAINATITDFNFSDILLVRDNTTNGFTNDAKFVANSGNAGISPTFIFMNNNWGANSITKSITGKLGKFIGSK